MLFAPSRATYDAVLSDFDARTTLAVCTSANRASLRGKLLENPELLDALQKFMDLGGRPVLTQIEDGKFRFDETGPLPADRVLNCEAVNQWEKDLQSQFGPDLVLMSFFRAAGIVDADLSNDWFRGLGETIASRFKPLGGEVWGRKTPRLSFSI